MDPLGATSSQEIVRLVAILMGAAIGTCVLFMPRSRRTPIERPIEPEDQTSEEDSPKK